MHGDGTRESFGTFSLVTLSGTWRGMGRRYGELMGDKLRELYRVAVTETLLGEQRREAEHLKGLASSFFALYPHRFKEFLRGMAETSGLDLSQHLLLNALEVVAAESLVRPHCSGIAAWGDYTGGGPLVFGRNYDYLPEFRRYAPYLQVLVLRPADGSRPVAAVGYAGTCYVTTALNADGLFLELNNGMPSGGALWYESRIPTIAALLGFLLDSTSLEELDGHFQTVRANFAYIVSVADDRVARCYEWPVFDVKRRPSYRPGLLVATNHFAEPDWGLPEPDDGAFWLTLTRRKNLMALGEHFKGDLGPLRMREILDTSIPDLGATSDLTVYQIVAVPQTRTLWLKAPEVQDWTEIPLAEALAPSGER